MSSQITWKFVLIGLVILACIFSLIGFPPPTSLSALKQSIADRIKLGLDLKGGSHLVLQVQVDEAIGQLREKGVTIEAPMDTPVCRIATFEDPEGNQIILHQITVPH